MLFRVVEGVVENGKGKKKRQSSVGLLSWDVCAARGASRFPPGPTRGSRSPTPRKCVIGFMTALIFRTDAILSRRAV